MNGAIIGLALGVFVGNTVIYGLLGNWTKGLQIGAIAAVIFVALGLATGFGSGD